MSFRKVAGLMGLAAGMVPAAAQAECLGNGCYSGLGWLLAGAVAVALLVLGALIFVAVRVFRRKGGKSATLFVLAALVAGFLFLVGWSGYWL